jgi:hypothetical protein
MPCIPGLPVTCLGDVTGAAGGVVTGALGNGFADAMREGAAWVIKTTIGWWIDVPAIDLAASPAATIRSYVLWLAAAVAAGGIIWQGVLLAVSRRSQHALDVGRGLFTLALWSAVGIAGPAAALRAGDAFSVWVLDTSAHGQAADRLVSLASLNGIQSPGAVIVLGLLMMLAGLAQAVLMMFREGALVILSGVVVLAAAGSMTHATRPWLPKVIGWMLALICYKPAAALVYATAITLVGEGTDPRTVIVGLTMMLLALVALPMLMKLFTWASGSATGGGGGLATLAGASAAAIHAGVALRSAPSSSAAAQAGNVRADLGPVAGPPSSGAGSAAAGASHLAGGTSGAAAGGAAAAGAAAAGPLAAVMVAQAAAQTATRAAGVAGAAMTEGESR